MKRTKRILGLLASLLMLSSGAFAAGGPDCERAMNLPAGISHAETTDFGTGTENWYRYVPVKDGIIAIDNCSSASDALLRVATGRECGFLSDAVLTLNSCTAGGTAVSLNAQKDVPVYIQWQQSATGADTEWRIMPSDPDTLLGYRCDNPLVASVGNNIAPFHYSSSLYYRYTAVQDGTVVVSYNKSDAFKSISVYDTDCNSLIAVSKSNIISFEAQKETKYIISFETESAAVTEIPDFEWNLTVAAPIVFDCNADTISNGSYKVGLVNGQASYRFFTNRTGSLYISNPDGVMILFKGDCTIHSILNTSYNVNANQSLTIEEPKLGPGSYFIQFLQLGTTEPKDFEFFYKPEPNKTAETCANPEDIAFLNGVVERTADLSSYPMTFYRLEAKATGEVSLVFPQSSSVKMYVTQDCNTIIAASTGNILQFDVFKDSTYIILMQDSLLNIAPAITWKATFNEIKLGSSSKFPLNISLGQQTLDLSASEREYYLYTADETTMYQFSNFSAQIPYRVRIMCEDALICDTVALPFRISMESGKKYLIEFESIKSDAAYTWNLSKNTNQLPIATDATSELKMQSMPATPLLIDIAEYFSDPEGDELRYSYRCDIQDNLTVKFVDGHTLELLSGAEGSVTVITLYAYDRISGFDVPTTVTVNVEKQDHGTVTSTTIPDQYIEQNRANVILDASKYFTQTKDSALTYTYNAPECVTVNQDGSIFTLAYQSVGTGTLIITATDEFGSTSSQNVAIKTSLFTGYITTTGILDQLIDLNTEKSINVANYFKQTADYPMVYTVSATSNTLAASISGSYLLLSSDIESDWIVYVTASDEFDHSYTDTINVVSSSLVGSITALTVADTTVYSDEPVVLDVSKFFTVDGKLQVTYDGEMNGNIVTANLVGSELTMSYKASGTDEILIYALDQYGRIVSTTFNVTSVERVTAAGSIFSTPIPAAMVTATSALELDLSKYFTQTAGHPLLFTFGAEYPSNINLSGSILKVTYVSDGNISLKLIVVDDYANIESSTIDITFRSVDNGTVIAKVVEPVKVTPEKNFVLDLSQYFTQTKANDLVYDFYTDDSTGITIAGSKVTVTYASFNNKTIRFKASDAFGSSATADLAVTYSSNHAPRSLNKISLNFTSIQAAVLNLNEYFSDADDDVLSFKVKSLTANGIIDLKLDASSLTVTPLSTGAVSFEIVASDKEDSVTIAVPVKATIPVSTPVITKKLPLLTITQAQVYELNLTEYFAHSVLKPLTFSYSFANEDLSVTAMPNNVLKIEAIKVSESEMKITASDADNKSVEQYCTVKVIEPAKAPEWVNADSTVTLTKTSNTKTIDLATLLTSSNGATYTFTLTDKIGKGAVKVTRANDVMTISSESAGTAVIAVTAKNSISQTVKPFLITVYSSVNAELNPVSAKKAIADTVFIQGFSSAVIDLNGIFAEANGKSLTYTIIPAANTVVDLGIIGSRLSILEKAFGTVPLTIVATNPDGKSTSVSFSITVNEKIIPISFITLPSSVEVPIGSIKNINALIIPVDARFKTLTWDVSPADIVSILTEEGYVTITGIKAGKATLTLTADNGVKSSMTVTVTEPQIQSLGLMFDKTTLAVGAQMSLPLVVSPSDFSITKMTIVASDPTVVSVVDGVMHALAIGTSAITVQAGSRTVTFNLTVSETPVAADTVIIRLTGSPVAKISLEVQPVGAVIGDYSLQSSDNAVAYIENGYLHAIAPGTVTLTLTAGGAAVGKLVYTVANTAPVIKSIPVQSGAKDGNFRALILSEYVTDDFTTSSDIVWTVKNASMCKIKIVDGAALTSLTNQYWNGTETVTFVATDALGASAERTVTFNTAAVSTMSVPTPELSVYPNPANEMVTVVLGEGAFEVKIFTLGGNSALPAHSAEQGICTIDVSALPTGMYLVQVLSENKLFTELLSVE